jgi:ketosteroid isomerase-like protein
MTITASTATSAEARISPVETIEAFFLAYREHDVEGMTDLCSDNADFSYIPYEVWGKQRVIRGDGKVRTVGKTLWSGFINAFPDFSNTVHTITANETGDVVVQVDLLGTQQLPWGFIRPAGRYFSEPHLFLFHIDEQGLIDRVSAYWNNAGISRQLGHLEVD